MKIIDLLNKMANKEKLPKKILIRDEVYYLINDTNGDIVYSHRMDKKDWEAFIDHRFNITRCLNEEVLTLDTGIEISEDNTIDIENQKIKFEVFNNISEEDKNEYEEDGYKFKDIDINFGNIKFEDVFDLKAFIDKSCYKKQYYFRNKFDNKYIGLIE